jgi:hypothetical protein
MRLSVTCRGDSVQCRAAFDDAFYWPQCPSSAHHDFPTGRDAAGLFCYDAFRASRPATTMNVLGELHAVAAKLSPYDDRPTCECCGQGKLELIDERPDPIFGVLGMTCQTLKCDFLECGKLTIV